MAESKPAPKFCQCEACILQARLCTGSSVKQGSERASSGVVWVWRGVGYIQHKLSRRDGFIFFLTDWCWQQLLASWQCQILWRQSEFSWGASDLLVLDEEDNIRFLGPDGLFTAAECINTQSCPLASALFVCQLDVNLSTSKGNAQCPTYFFPEGPGYSVGNRCASTRVATGLVLSLRLSPDSFTLTRVRERTFHWYW